jgi:hypothetical protein
VILPTKHVSNSESLLGIGAVILRILDAPQTVTRLWEELGSTSNIASFQRFLLALDLLYALNAVEISEGLLRRRAS